MSNMSYCRFHNTAIDLDDCKDTLEALFDGSLEYPISREERRKAAALVEMCRDIVSLVGEEIGSIELDEVDEQGARAVIDEANERLEEAREEEEEDERREAADLRVERLMSSNPASVQRKER